MSIPMETKNRLVNRSRMGSTLPTAWSPKGEEEMINPAAKAPRARERPAHQVSVAMPRQRTTTMRRNISRLRVAATRDMAHGTSQRPAQDQNDKHHQAFYQQGRQRQACTCPGSGQKGHGYHHGDHRQVLENQDGQTQSPDRALQG